VSDMLLEARSEHRLSQTLQRVLNEVGHIWRAARRSCCATGARADFRRWATSKNDPEGGPFRTTARSRAAGERYPLFEMRGAAAFGVSVTLRQAAADTGRVRRSRRRSGL
jgi:hypothetical protein